MTEIIRAGEADAEVLVQIGTNSFKESHGASAPKEDIDDYVHSKFNLVTFKAELTDTNNHFYIIYHDSIPIGYSKIIMNFAHPSIELDHVAKMERLYLLKEFHHLKLGLELFNFNVSLSKTHGQSGLHLFVYTENEKALAFYKKAGFKIIGHFDFKISDRHTNPNHHMLLVY